MTGIRDAIEDTVREACEENGSTTGLVVGEFVIIAGTNGWDDEGEPVSQVIVLPYDGSESRILGLIEHARTTLKADIIGYGALDD